MKKTPSISEAEWDVMAVIWEENPVTSQDITERLSPQKGWSPQTVKTLLSRLVKKGVLSYRQEGKAYLYQPRVSREVCIREESRSFAERVFGGDPTPLLANLVRDTKLSPADIKRLRQILREKEE